MRETLEGTAARYAARHASEAEIQDLAELVESERETGGDRASRAEVNDPEAAARFLTSITTGNYPFPLPVHSSLYKAFKMPASWSLAGRYPPTARTADEVQTVEAAA